MSCYDTDQSVTSPLKPRINPTFRDIVVQVWIFSLERAKKAFSAEIFPWKWHLFHYPHQIYIFIITCSAVFAQMGDRKQNPI
jgi:uncharacterized protein (DUF2132 family)